MAKARALEKRRKAVSKIRKITRTMELIATGRFKKAMDRAHASTAYTRRMTQLVADLANSGLEVSHPLLEEREEVRRAVLLVMTANRGYCGGYSSNVLRIALARATELKSQAPQFDLEVSGKRGIVSCKHRRFEITQSYTHFEDKPTFEQVEVLANRYLEEFTAGKLDRLDVAYTRFENASRQFAVVETLLPLGALGDATSKSGGAGKQYEFLPSAATILEEIVPTSFRIKLFKCFLDAAVSEQIARMVAMKSATKAAGDRIKQLSIAYNRARQTQITSELLDLMGGVEALKN